jgi:hypothetical protein
MRAMLLHAMADLLQPTAPFHTDPASAPAAGLGAGLAAGALPQTPSGVAQIDFGDLFDLPVVDRQLVLPDMVENGHLAAGGGSPAAPTTAAPDSVETFFHQPDAALIPNHSVNSNSTLTSADFPQQWTALAATGSVPGGQLPHGMEQVAAAGAGAAGPSWQPGQQQPVQLQGYVPGMAPMPGGALQQHQPMELDNMPPLPPQQQQQEGMHHMMPVPAPQQQVHMVPQQQQQDMGMAHMVPMPAEQQQVGMVPMPPPPLPVLPALLPPPQQQHPQVDAQVMLQTARAVAAAASNHHHDAAAAAAQLGVHLRAPRLKASLVAGEITCRTVKGAVTGAATGYRCCVPLCGQPALALSQTHICWGCFNQDAVDLGVGAEVHWYSLNRNTHRFQPAPHGNLQQLLG